MGKAEMEGRRNRKEISRVRRRKREKREGGKKTLRRWEEGEKKR